MLVLASLVLGFAIFDALSRFVVVWLHLTPTRSCLGVTIWDASPDVESIRAYPSLFFTPCEAILTILVCATRWLIYIFTPLLTCPCVSLAC